MNSGELLLAFADVKEEYLRSAEDLPALRRSFRQQREKKVRAAAASGVCLVAAAFALFFVVRQQSDRPALPSKPSGGVTNEPQSVPLDAMAPSVSDQTAAGMTTAPTVAEGVSDLPTVSAEIAIELPWEQKSVDAQYPSLTFRGVEYGVGRSEILQSYFGSELGSALLTGYDIYTDDVHETALPVYALSGISTDCALGVRFPNGVCFAYVNRHYAPATLGDFLADLDLRKTLQCGAGELYYTDAAGQHHTLTFDDFDDAPVWALLLSDGSLKNEGMADGARRIDFSVSVLTLGYRNMALWITEDGYLVTNLLETAKAFYIGQDRADAFEAFLRENVPLTENPLQSVVDADPIPE